MTSVFHVAISGDDGADGSAERPFRTINRAAGLAQAGDSVVVHAGEYREWVTPRRGGLSDTRRITYAAAPGEHVVIKGSERITGWVPDGGTVWKAVVPNALFGTFNPFAEEVAGDWIVYAKGAPRKHLGDVYLNGRSFFEAAARAELDDPPLRTAVRDDWTGLDDRVRDPEQTRLLWYAEVAPETTTIWANFAGADPNAELAEINVRRSVFYPLVPHLDFITVRGFELAQAATPWTPPTADQPGLIGPNWARGWIIEDNVIHDAKCSAISLGKEASTGHNYATERGDKPGYQYQLESVFAARQIGWDREHVGSHIVRRNKIFDCGQNGIVGHLGCVFSTIEDNDIAGIALKREFYGYEIGGIKLHAAIDVTIRHNHIHDCSLGIWLDWQTQGTRISRNVLHSNNRDLFVEVSHGPYLVEHNVLGSAAAIELFSQGGAFVNNLILGTLRLEAVLDRATPYHRPHSTQVAGYAVIIGGDDRWTGNVFVGRDPATAYGPETHGEGPAHSGTHGYDGFPASYDEYLDRVGDPSLGDHRRFAGIPQPAYLDHNVYAAGAQPFAGERNPLVLPATPPVPDAPAPADMSADPGASPADPASAADGSSAADARSAGGGASAAVDTSVAVVVDGDAVYLVTELPAAFDELRLAPVTGRDLGRVRLVDAEFEERDGSPAIMAADLTGAAKNPDGAYAAGPIAALASGTGRTRIW